MRKTLSVFVFFTLLFSLTASCIAAPQEVIIGEWKGDFELFLTLPEGDEQFDADGPEFREAKIDFYNLLHNLISIEINKEEMTLDFGSGEPDITSYTITDTTDDQVYITIEKVYMDTIILRVIDEDHIVMYTVVDEGEVTLDYCLQRVK